MNTALVKELTEADTLRIACAECLGAEWRALPQPALKTPTHKFLVFPALYNLDGSCDLPMATGHERMCNTTFMWKNGHIPDYAGNAQDALILVDALREQGWCVTLNNGLDGTWECMADNPLKPATVFAPADTMAFAVCRAFLKVHGRLKLSA